MRDVRGLAVTEEVDAYLRILLRISAGQVRLKGGPARSRAGCHRRCRWPDVEMRLDEQRCSGEVAAR